MEKCWCDNTDLQFFSPDYQVCNRCQTLILSDNLAKETTKADKDGLYSKSYWFEHQKNDLGLSDIVSRSRSDIPERVLYWLQTFLKYQTLPGKTLEIGCSHGGFVAMLQWTGFQAYGLELDQWVVDFAHQTFQIPIFLGKLEEQTFEPGTFDALILMDVLEHLDDPLTTIQMAQKLLKPGGFLFIQTPCYPTDYKFENLLSENHPFLMMLRPPEHIFLFNKSSVTQLLQSCGLTFINFEAAIFDQYDMFLVASSSPLFTHTQEEIDQSLLATPTGRLVLALLDKSAECKILSKLLKESDTDRADRWDQIQQYDVCLKESEAEKASLKSSLNMMQSSLPFRIGKRFGLWK